MNKIDIPAKRFDVTIVNFLQKHIGIIFLITASVIAIALRFQFQGFFTQDMTKYYMAWSDHLAKNGGFAGIPSLHTDYPVLYHYILALLTYFPGYTPTKIKIVSWLFDFIAAGFVGLFVSKLLNRPKLSTLPILAYVITLFLPTIVLNSALWGQCDIIYATFILISLYFFYDERYGMAFIFYGIALSLKLQALFMLPFFIILYFKQRRFSILHFLFLPAVYLLTYLPALLLGKPFNELFEAYGMQLTAHPGMVLNFPNLYMFLPDDYALFSVPALLLTAIALGTFAYLVISRKSLVIEKSKLIEFAIIILILCVYFLPSIHERYLFTADLLAVFIFLSNPGVFTFR